MTALAQNGLHESADQKVMNLVARHTSTIYVLDSERIVLTTLQGFLADLGFAVETFASLTALGPEQPDHDSAVDVILLDPSLPGQTSGQVLRALRGRFPKAALVVMTGVSGVLPLAEAVSQGVYAYLNKPIRLGELELLLLRILESRASS